MVVLKGSGTAKSAFLLQVSPEILREIALRLETTAANAPYSHAVTLDVCEGLTMVYEPPRGISERYSVSKE